MGQRAWMAGAATLMLAAAGCFWPAPGAGPSRTGHNVFEDRITPDTVTGLEEVWTGRTDGGTVRGPVTSNQMVHVVANSTVYGFDARTGARLWDATPEGVAPDIWWMTPAVFAGDVLWTGSGVPNLGGFYVTELLDPDTGDVVGELSPAGWLDGVRGNGYVLRRGAFAGSDPSLPVTVSITVRDSQEGVGWSGTIAVLPFGTPSVPLTLGRNLVYQVGAGMSVDADGNVVQSNGIRGYTTPERPDLCQWDVPITVVCPTWFTPLQGGPTPPVLAPDESGLEDGTLFTGTSAGMVYALEAATGDILWSSPVGAAVGAEPALADGNLYVPTTDGRLVVLDADDGGILWEAPAGGAVRAQPVVAGGVVFTGAAGGSLHAFDAGGCGTATCDPLWSESTGSNITGAPAVSKGQLYVGTADGRVIAYGLPQLRSPST